jgi:hypothetical protein
VLAHGVDPEQVGAREAQGNALLPGLAAYLRRGSSTVRQSSPRPSLTKEGIEALERHRLLRLTGRVLRIEFEPVDQDVLRNLIRVFA